VKRYFIEKVFYDAPDDAPDDAEIKVLFLD
jgi:hypothetical protein